MQLLSQLRPDQLLVLALLLLCLLAILLDALRTACLQVKQLFASLDRGDGDAS